MPEIKSTLFCKIFAQITYSNVIIDVPGGIKETSVTPWMSMLLSGWKREMLRGSEDVAESTQKTLLKLSVKWKKFCRRGRD